MTFGRALAWFALLAACAPRRHAPIASVPAQQEAYVWQRRWTPAVRDAVAHVPARIAGLHVLAAELAVGDVALRPLDLDQAALEAARRPITLVVRIDGSRPVDALSLAPVRTIAESLREAHVAIAGIEVDHDCATAALADYARWLAAQRGATTHLSITALPTWAGSPALGAVASAVDEIVVQVHAVRAPAIFDPNVAWHDLARFANAVHATPLRVALPTYDAVVRGMAVEADAQGVAAFVRRLAAEPVPGVAGIVWFRLPVAGDSQTWSPATFASVVETGRADAPRARITLVASGDDRFDVIATNPGGELVDLPTVHVAGTVDAAELIGFRELGNGAWAPPHRSLAANETLTIGWIRGKDIALVD